MFKDYRGKEFEETYIIDKFLFIYIRLYFCFEFIVLLRFDK